MVTEVILSVTLESRSLNVQQAIPKQLSGVLARFEGTYSKLKVDALVVFATLGLLVALMCVGAYQEAVRQGSFYLGVMPEQDPFIMQVVSLVNQYGLAALIALCYFSNVSHDSKRRELMIDALCIGFGAALPQLTFHATWLYVLYDLITTNAQTVSSVTVGAIYTEWLVTLGLVALTAGLIAQAVRVIRRK